MPQEKEYEGEVLAAVKLFASSVSAGRGVIADMSPLVEATSNLPLKNLDVWERLLRWEFSNALRASAPAAWKFWRQSAPFLTWLDLCSEDGFMREKTLRSLSGPAPNSFFFTLVIRRLNDWVPQVREAARQKLLIIAKASNPEHVAEALCAALPHWTSWVRMEDQDRQALIDIVSVEEIANSLKAKIISSASGPFALVLSQIGRTEILDHHLTEIAKDAIQPSVRAKAYRSLLEGRMVWFIGRKWEWTDKRYCEGRLIPIIGERSISIPNPYAETLVAAATDSSPMVRRIAGEMLIRRPEAIGEESVNLAKLLASDPSPSVSERGMFVLKRLAGPAL